MAALEARSLSGLRGCQQRLRLRKLRIADPVDRRPAFEQIKAACHHPTRTPLGFGSRTRISPWGARGIHRIRHRQVRTDTRGRAGTRTADRSLLRKPTGKDRPRAARKITASIVAPALTFFHIHGDHTRNGLNECRNLVVRISWPKLRAAES